MRNLPKSPSWGSCLLDTRILMDKSLSWCRARLRMQKGKEIDSNNTSAKLTQQFLGPRKSELGRALTGSQEGYQAS